MSKSISVLFVDDQALVLQIIERTLARSPFEVLVAESGEAALRILKERPVDVLVSDIDMPGMSGLQLVRAARRDYPATMRMFLTGAATMERVMEALNEGEATRFFTKPFDITVFRLAMEALADQIEKSRADGEATARRQRRAQMKEWIDVNCPGILEAPRNERGEVVVDASALGAAIDTTGYRDALAVLI